MNDRSPTRTPREADRPARRRPLRSLLAASAIVCGSLAAAFAGDAGGFEAPPGPAAASDLAPQPAADVTPRPPTSFDVGPRLAAATEVYHVKTTGSDSDPGSATRPFQTVRRAVSAAGAGDTIKVHAGTYEGVVTLRKSGERNAPIVLMGAGDGEATLSADFETLDCAQRAPTHDRTLQVVGGADNWTIRDLSIVNGILILAPKTQVLENRNFSDRSLPGHGATPDSAAADRVLPSFGIDPSDSIRLLHLDVRGRGLLTIGARHGEVADSRFHDIDCGTGAAVWLNRFSDGWHVHDNQVQDVAASKQHYMSEGIRLGSGSSYNLVERNVVEHLQGQGRGITADVGASWNVYRDNRVTDTAINYSEQAAGWGNHYIANLSRNARRTGYQVYGIGALDEGKRRDAKLRRKGSLKKMEAAEDGGGGGDSTPRYLLFQCNDSQDDPVAFNAGDVAESRFLDNNFASVRISQKLRSAWSARKNVWDGGASQPPERPSTSAFASCRTQAGASGR